MSGFGLQADFYNSLTPADIENKELKEKLAKMEEKKTTESYFKLPEGYKEDILLKKLSEGYSSPIMLNIGEIETKMENDMIETVQRYGFSVDKEELLKALNYDRGQYDKGYDKGFRDGMKHGAALIKNYIDNTWFEGKESET